MSREEPRAHDGDEAWPKNKRRFMSQVALLQRIRIRAMAVVSAFALLGASSAAAEVKLDEAATIVGSTTQWDSFDPAATTVASLTGRWLSPVYDLLVNLQADGSFAPGLA